MPAPADSPRQRDPVPTDSRYECLLKIASGGMATVYVGRLRGRYGFSRLVAIKRAHAHLVDDDTFRHLMIGEARLASRIHHPNVVSVLDVDEPRDELLLVMDYVEGASLSQLLTATQSSGKPLPLDVTLRIVIDVCAGLHAAHELVGEGDEPLSIVHRDVSPQNVLVGVDGQSRITDFGVAKWNEATQATTAGWKGKFAYMAPEYIRDRVVDRRSDVFGIGVILWEALANRRLFRGESGADTMLLVTTHEAEPLDVVAPHVPAAFGPIVARALAKNPDARYATAAELGEALEQAARANGVDLGPAVVSQTVRELHGSDLDARRAVLRGLLTDGGDTTSQASDLVSGRPLEGPITATGAHMVTLSDARTLPVQRRVPVEPTILPEQEAVLATISPEETHAPVSNVPPAPVRTSGRARLIAGVAAVAALSAGVTWELTSASTRSAALSSEPVRVAATTARSGAGAPASTVVATDQQLGVPAAPAQAVGSGLATASASSHAHARAATSRPPSSSAPVATATPPQVRPSTPADVAPASPAPTRPDRPGLGY